MSGLRVNVAWILLTLGFLFGESLCVWAFMASPEYDVRLAAVVIAAGIFGLAWYAAAYTANPPKPKPWEKRRGQ